ncbi:MAG: CDP-alcohol phosphatidyltransferase family protein [Deltaproteobacteria bacterium]|nr:MAG: CDP-alcohol phosphatidyltransferase family protein [Deltaproteobacteria bacterium]
MQLDERFDIMVSRPIANRMARGFFKLGFNADMVSMIAAACGVGAGIAMTGSGLWPVIGGALLIAMVIVDCADGAVARMHPPSDRPWRGRMFDGIADLATLLSVHIGMVIALSNASFTLGGYTFGGLEAVLIGVAGFISFTWKSSVVDDIKQRLKGNSCDRDVDTEKYAAQKKSLFEKFLFFLWVWYVKNSEKLTGPGRPGGYELFRQVALVGPSHHLVALAISAMLLPLAPTIFISYVLLTAGPGNLYLWYVLSRARREHAGAEA